MAVATLRAGRLNVRQACARREEQQRSRGAVDYPGIKRS
jgi:hypothetical protein